MQSYNYHTYICNKVPQIKHEIVNDFYKLSRDEFILKTCY